MSKIHRFQRNTKPFQNERRYRAPWYDTTRWRSERILFIQEHPECESCIAQGRRGIPSTVVDHVNPISKYPEHQREEAFWNRYNWQALCQQCHNRKSQSERI